MRLDRTFSYRLHRLHKLSDIATQRAYETELNLTLGEGRCLAAIGAFADEAGQMSVKDLARHANLDKSQASRSAQALIDLGLVHKTNRPDDLRSVCLELTRQGLKTYRQSLVLIERRNQEIFGVLSEQQKLALSDAFDVLLRAHASEALEGTVE
jgi:DNA-binding MarR family transcriptional regulator